MDKTPVEIYFKGLVKRIIWNFTRVEKSDSGKKDIIIFTLGRSGGTWLTEIIAAEKGIRSVGQPLSYYQLGEDELKQFPIFDSGRFIFLDEDEKKSIKRYVDKILRGEFHVNEPWNFWSPSFEFTANRHILKLTNANATIDWFAKAFDVDIIYLVRHPIPKLLSNLKLGWGQSSKSYLRNKQFVENYLSDEEYDFGWKILKEGEEIEKHTLGWVLENLVPLKFSTELKNHIFLSYEENVLYPEETVRLLAERLKLTEVEKMMETVRKPSRTVGKKNTETVKKLNNDDFDHRNYMISKWKKDVDRDMETKAFDVLSAFSMDIYQPDRLIPIKKYLNFAESD